MKDEIIKELLSMLVEGKEEEEEEVAAQAGSVVGRYKRMLEQHSKSSSSNLEIVHCAAWPEKKERLICYTYPTNVGIARCTVTLGGDTSGSWDRGGGSTFGLLLGFSYH